MRYPFASLLVADIAPSLGIRVELEPEFQFAGELIFPDGRRHLFRNTNFNINPAGSTEIARDKGYTRYFLEKNGFPVPQGQTFFSEHLNTFLPPASQRGAAEAIAFAKSIGFPVFLKPNNLSQGVLVARVDTAEQLLPVAESIFAKTSVLLLEQFFPGRDYRIVVLGDEVISAYERVPFSVVGNGHDTIASLMERRRVQFTTQGRPNCEVRPEDPRIDAVLRRHNLDRHTVLLRGQEVFLLDNANLSTGGTARDVTESVHPSFKKMAVHAAKLIGLRLAGVDVLCENIGDDLTAQKWAVLELNAAPGLDNYAALGEIQLERVKGLYRKILTYLAANPI